MLLRFRVTNFASLRDEAELSLIATDDHPDLAVRAVPREKLSALPVAGIFGPNASGKSNIIKASRFCPRRGSAVSPALAAGGTDPGPVAVPARPRERERPSEFVFDFVVENVRYEFGFSLDDEESDRSGCTRSQRAGGRSTLSATAGHCTSGTT